MESWIPADAPGRMLRGPLDVAGLMVDACAEGARTFWSYWGPLGEPAIAVVDTVAGMQRSYLAWLGTMSGRWSMAGSE
jgi:hypothetical protein